MKTENRRDMSWDHLGSFHGLKIEKRGIKSVASTGYHHFITGMY